MSEWLAIDIGGANLKGADGRGYAVSQVFEMWREPQQLAQELRMLIAEAPPSDHLAVTMTGELADCFDSRSEGVEHIIRSVVDAAGGRHTRVYTLDGRLVTPQVALRDPWNVAASNWHALAQFAIRYAPEGIALLIDVGSTTCDIVPLIDGELAAAATSDTGRLLSGELVYTGVSRTPVCSIAERIPYRGQTSPLARELFATTRDVYIILGELPEETTSTHTADNRPATKAASRRRLARMICADDDQFNHRDAVTMAQSLAKSQAIAVAAALEQVISALPGKPQSVILSGQGEFLGRRAWESLEKKTESQGKAANVVSLQSKLGTAVSRAAPAHALAVLAREVSVR